MRFYADNNLVKYVIVIYLVSNFWFPFAKEKLN